MGYSICIKPVFKCKLSSLNAAVQFTAWCSSYVGEKKLGCCVKCAVSALTRCTRSRENMWILQVTVDRVQMMVDRMLRPHALNKRSCREIRIQKILIWQHNYWYLKDNFTTFQVCLEAVPKTHLHISAWNVNVRLLKPHISIILKLKIWIHFPKNEDIRKMNWGSSIG